jgi:hypothetical protein
MLIEELALGVPVDANILVQAEHLAAPQVLPLFYTETKRPFLNISADQLS